MALQSLILQQLLITPMSLADLEYTTQASLPTIRRAVQSLSESHWIEITGQAEANGGRPAMLYGINESYYMAFGLQLQLPGVLLIVTDLKGKILAREKLFHGITPEPNLAIRTIVDKINEIKAQFPQRYAIGLGIAAPGYIDQYSGDIVAIGRVPSWKNFPICRHLSEALGVPIQIANDVDCMAIAELEQYRPNQKNIIYLGFCEGVKASLFLNGELFKGSIGNVGLIDPDLLNLGELNKNIDVDRLLTTNGFIELFDQRVRNLDSASQERYQDITHIENENEKFFAILNRALDHDRICHPLVSNLCLTLATALASIIHSLQPDEVIIGGLLSSLPKPLFQNFEYDIRRLIPSLISNNLLIKQGMMNSKNIAAKGAIQYFLLSKMGQILQEN